MKEHKINFKCIICGHKADKVPLKCPKCNNKYPNIEYPDKVPLIDL